VLGFAGAKLPIRSLAAMIAGGVAVGSLVFPYDRALTGDALYTPQAEFRDTTAYPGADRFGFGADIGNLGWPHLDPLPGHGPADVVINLNRNLYQTNFELFGWSFGSLALAALPLLWRRMRRNDWLLLAFVASIVGGHSFYWFAGGPDFGARYWYQLLLPLAALTARGVEAVRARLAEAYAPAVSSERVALFVVAACTLSMINVVPWRSLGKYHRYREMTADVERLARQEHFGRSLVFVRVDDTGGGAIRDTTDYPSAFIFNPPTLESDATIYAYDAGPAHRQAVEAHFPDRPVWTIGRLPMGDGKPDSIDTFYRMQVLDGPVQGGHAPETPGWRHLSQTPGQNDRSGAGVR
jgi:hypothetical protein